MTKTVFVFEEDDDLEASYVDALEEYQDRTDGRITDRLVSVNLDNTKANQKEIEKYSDAWESDDPVDYEGIPHKVDYFKENHDGTEIVVVLSIVDQVELQK